jgi:hypothetical protein
MKGFLVLVMLIAVAVAVSLFLPGGGDYVVAKDGAAGEKAVAPKAGTDWPCPIAPGVWYPTDGPVPEKPMRYYRVRCWPGCHKGTPYGKYPDKSLKMDPIFPTSTVPGHPAAYSEGN